MKLRGAVVKPKSCSFGLGSAKELGDYGFKTINLESKTSSLRSGLDFKVKTLSAPMASYIHDPDLSLSPPNNFPLQPGTRPAKTIRKTKRSSLEMNTRHKGGLSGHPLHPLEKWRAAWQTGQVKRTRK